MSQRDAAKFRATSRASQGFEATPQEALADLTQALPGDAPNPIVIWPCNQGDASVEGGAAGPVTGAERSAESPDRGGALAGGLFETKMADETLDLVRWQEENPSAWGDQDENGVDLARLRENLKLTPAERLKRLDAGRDMLRVLQHARTKHSLR